MKTNKFLILILVILGLGVGYAAGFFVTRATTVVDSSAPAASKERIVRVNSGSAADAIELSKALSEIEALKAEKERLEKQLAANQPEEGTPPDAPEAQNDGRRMSMKERLEELKTSDPERYAEIMKRREEMEQRMAQMREERDSFLGSIDTSFMTEEEQANHARYMEMLAQQEALGEQFRTAMENGEEVSEEMRQQMFDTMREMRELQDAERTALLNAVGTSMGLSDDDVTDFTSLIQEVMSVTGSGGRGGPGGGLGGGGPGGGGPGGGGPGGR